MVVGNKKVVIGIVMMTQTQPGARHPKKKKEMVGAHTARLSDSIHISTARESIYDWKPNNNAPPRTGRRPSA
jgi:hypothetical protein